MSKSGNEYFRYEAKKNAVKCLKQPETNYKLLFLDISVSKTMSV